VWVERTARIPREELQGRWGIGPVGELEVGRTETPSFVNAVQSLLEEPLVRIENPNFADVIQKLLDSPLQPRQIVLLHAEQLLGGGVEKAVCGLRSPSLLALVLLEPLEWCLGLQIERIWQHQLSENGRRQGGTSIARSLVAILLMTCKEKIICP
jgi:hypothetical protein